MTDISFRHALELVLRDEGGNSDDPDDRGGRTSRGVTQREFDPWCAEQGIAQHDVWTATDDEIAQVYLTEYWRPMWCAILPPGADYAVFDMAVNEGCHEATLMLQRALQVNADGRIGPVTREAMRNADASALVANLISQRMEFYRHIASRRGQAKFLRGWLNRCSHVARNAADMQQASA